VPRLKNADAVVCGWQQKDRGKMGDTGRVCCKVVIEFPRETAPVRYRHTEKGMDSHSCGGQEVPKAAVDMLGNQEN
jgi:hypothetical protein